jgi:hypothetical protein
MNNDKITDAFVDQIVAIITRAGLSTASVVALRDAFPGIHFTHCLDDDISAGITAFREADGFNLYLIDGSQHCIAFTGSREKATGLVLAEVDDAP